MERREFLTTTAGLMSIPFITGIPLGQQAQSLGPETFARRIARLQEELKTRKLDLFISEPSPNFQYFARYNPGRSERLILLLVPLAADPVIICPSFEVERIKRN